MHLPNNLAYPNANNVHQTHINQPHMIPPAGPSTMAPLQGHEMHLLQSGMQQPAHSLNPSHLSMMMANESMVDFNRISTHPRPAEYLDNMNLDTQTINTVVQPSTSTYQNQLPETKTVEQEIQPPSDVPLPCDTKEEVTEKSPKKVDVQHKKLHKLRQRNRFHYARDTKRLMNYELLDMCEDRFGYEITRSWREQASAYSAVKSALVKDWFDHPDDPSSWPSRMDFSKDHWRRIKEFAHLLNDREKQCVIMAHHETIHLDNFNTKLVALKSLSAQSGKTKVDVLVITARGFKSDWKIPIGLFNGFTVKTTKNQEHNTIEETITRLMDVGFQPKAFVCDFTEKFRRCANRMKVTTEKPAICVDCNYIPFLFDTPQLMVATYNGILQGPHVFQDMYICIDHIFEAYRCNNTFRVSMVPKVTENHVNSRPRTRRQLKDVLQLFSDSMASCMRMLMRFGKLTEDTKATMQFVQRIDKLFDVLNSSRADHRCVYKRAFSGLPQQVEFLQNMCDYLTSVTTLKKPNTKFTWMYSWIINAKAMQDIWNEDVKDLKMQRLNLDVTRGMMAAFKTEKSHEKVEMVGDSEMDDIEDDEDEDYDDDDDDAEFDDEVDYDSEQSSSDEDMAAII